ncbi:hypothetical protein MKX01_017558 [Papaver californicum]|nr:hypothetical protein MKX01_017558 [Papaver californicum]
MSTEVSRWGLDLIYSFVVALIWVASNSIVSDSGDQVRLLANKTGLMLDEDEDSQLDAKGWWTRIRATKISLLLCPFWFLANLSFNLFLNFFIYFFVIAPITILSNTSSLFAFLLSLGFPLLTWIKLISILLCMGGSIIVSFGDMESGLNDLHCIFRKTIPVDDAESGCISIVQIYGYLGLLNMLIFLPFVVLLHFTKVEQFHSLSWSQTGLIDCKSLLDKVLGDYLWAKVVLLTTKTVVTTGLTIQVPMVAGIDAIRDRAPNLMDHLGAVIHGWIYWYIYPPN